MRCFGKYTTRFSNSSEDRNKERFIYLKRRFMNSKFTGSIVFKNSLLTDNSGFEENHSFILKDGLILKDEIKNIKQEEMIDSQIFNDKKDCLTLKDEIKNIKQEEMIDSQLFNESYEKYKCFDVYKNESINKNNDFRLFKNGIRNEIIDKSNLMDMHCRSSLSVNENLLDGVFDDLSYDKFANFSNSILEDTKINHTSFENWSKRSNKNSKFSVSNREEENSISNREEDFHNNKRSNKNSSFVSNREEDFHNNKRSNKNSKFSVSNREEENFLKEIENLENYFFKNKNKIIEKYKDRCDSNLIKKIIYNPINFHDIFASTYDVFSENDLLQILNCEIINFELMPKSPVKIAEASFSEVFKINDLIYKIIPLDANFSKFNFLKEIAVMVGLRNNEGICRIIDFFFIKGKYSEPYIKAWNSFKDTENINPNTYSEDQEYGCIVMEDCGVDLESYVFNSGDEIILFFVNIVKYLFNLQDKYKFEHRDLHWGNVMIKNNHIYILDFAFCRFEINPKEIITNLNALQIEKISNNNIFKREQYKKFKKIKNCKDPQDNVKIIYTDLSKEDWLFTGNGKIDPQFSVYKKMKIISSNEWKTYNPDSNGLWSGYLIKKLIKKSQTLNSGNEVNRTYKILKLIENNFKSYKWNHNFLNWLTSNLKNFIINH